MCMQIYTSHASKRSSMFARVRSSHLLSRTRQQTLVLLLSNCCCPFYVVASRILILLFRYWLPLIRFPPRDLHFFISRCSQQLFL
jgi:hypothetical protein